MKNKTMKMAVALLLAAMAGLASCTKLVDGNDGNEGNVTPPTNVEGSIDGLIWATSNCGATSSRPEGKYYSATSAELRSLSAHSSGFTTYDGLKGNWLSGKKAYSSSSPAVFFPATGYKESSGTLRLKGSMGIYWSSTKDGAYEVLYIGAESAPEVGVDQDEEASYQLRCVKK